MKSDTPLSSPDPDETVESLLRRAAPAPLEAALFARLRQACPETPAESAPIHYFPWKLMAAAAALALAGWGLASVNPKPVPAALVHQTPPAVPPTAPAADPQEVNFYPALESRQQLLSVRDLGVVRDSRQRPVRLMSTTWLDENTYGGPGEKPPLHESRFRHEIVPVLLPTY